MHAHNRVKTTVNWAILIKNEFDFVVYLKSHYIEKIPIRA